MNGPLLLEMLWIVFNTQELTLVVVLQGHRFSTLFSVWTAFMASFNCFPLASCNYQLWSINCSWNGLLAASSWYNLPQHNMPCQYVYVHKLSYMYRIAAAPQQHSLPNKEPVEYSMHCTGSLLSIKLVCIVWGTCLIFSTEWLFLFDSKWTFDLSM